MIVTHNMQQAARVAEMTAFFSLQVEEDGRHGILVEYDSTEKIFTHRPTSAPRATSPAGSDSMRSSFTRGALAARGGAPGRRRLVLRALRSALNALARGDDELADEVIGFDDEIDRRYLAIEEGVQSLLARQTPVATDLRLVLAVLRVNLHLERMADYCVTVAKLTKLMGGLDVSDEAILSSLEDMGQRAEQMIRVAIDSFADRDAEKAQLARRARRADRPREPQRRSRTCSRSATRPRSASTACGCSSSRAASSGSATTPSTSASRSPTSSPASSASSPTPRTRAYPDGPPSSERRRRGRHAPDAARERAHVPRRLVAHRPDGARRRRWALGRLVPDVSDVTRWPYALVGAGFGLLGLVFIWLGFARARRSRRALARGAFPPARRAACTRRLLVAGLVLGVAVLLVVICRAR